MVNYDILNGKESIWINPRLIPYDIIRASNELIVSDEDIFDAEERLERFAPFLMKKFHATQNSGGIIESELRDIPQLHMALQERYSCEIPGRLMLKMDSHLAISGSVKARGGFYEVLKHAEDLVLKNGIITKDDCYTRFADDDVRTFLSNYTIQVGSTGNLGMSIGIMSEALGFNVIVHMSSDAKQWKKDLLRKRGVQVIEYNDDYSGAVSEGRKNSNRVENSYFIDDEWSIDLFLGYAVAANRLRTQLIEKNISADENHPLIVYIPAGVGGAPGGISYGLKRIYGDNVHCFFIEPTQCPSLLLGMATQRFEKANVREFGITGITEADGLACASPSGFITRIMNNIVSGIFTVKDGRLYDFLRMLDETENIRIEPSACAGFIAPINLTKYKELEQYCMEHNLSLDKLQNTTHIVWATGGNLVPENIMEQYLNTAL